MESGKTARSISPYQPRSTSRLSRLLLAVSFFVFTLCLSVSSVFTNNQLEFMDGMAEEHFILGWDWNRTGNYAYRNCPAVLRAPGYPFFVAAVLRTREMLVEETSLSKPSANAQAANPIAAFRAIYVAQCILLSLSAVIVFIWLSRFISSVNAFFVAFLFGSNIYMLVHTGLLHYEILHIFATVVSTYVLTIALEDNKGSALKVLAGQLWGLTTLVRPMTLLLPPFVFLGLAIRHKSIGKPVLKATFAFALGMMLTIAPYTLRNYAVIDRFIPVNAQTGVALWASTVTKLERSPNNYRWDSLFATEGMPLYSKVTGASEYSFSQYVRCLMDLEDTFKHEALQNILQKPDVYLHNVALNFFTFNVDINSVVIKLYQVIQRPNTRIHQSWLWAGTKEDFFPSTLSATFTVFINILSVLSLLGVILGLANRQRDLVVPLLVYLCFCFTHSISYMDLMYYYVKIPFLFIFFGCFLSCLEKLSLHISVGGHKVSLAPMVAGGVSVFSLALTALVLFRSYP